MGTNWGGPPNPGLESCGGGCNGNPPGDGRFGTGPGKWQYNHLVYIKGGATRVLNQDIAMLFAFFVTSFFKERQRALEYPD